MSPRTSAGGSTRLYGFFKLGPLASGYAVHEVSLHTPNACHHTTSHHVHITSHHITGSTVTVSVGHRQPTAAPISRSGARGDGSRTPRRGAIHSPPGPVHSPQHEHRADPHGQPTPDRFRMPTEAAQPSPCHQPTRPCRSATCGRCQTPCPRTHSVSAHTPRIQR